MQNCLQSKKGSKKGKIKLVILLIFACAAMVSAAKFLDNDVADGDFENRSEYVPSSRVRFAQAAVKEAENTESEMAEMNNAEQNNAKTGDFYENNRKMFELERKNVRILQNDGNVCEMELEEYVLGCLIGEMPSSFELEALMAQSVAVRSFTVRRMLYGTSKHKNADVCTNSNCCQCYVTPAQKGLSQSSYDKMRAAVDATRGMVALYEGIPIDAAYHASSGYYTKNSEDVWNEAVPYLRSVKAPDGEAEICVKQYFFSYGELSKALSDSTGIAVSCGAFGAGVETNTDDYKLASSLNVGGISFDKTNLKKTLGLKTNQFDVEYLEDALKVTCYGNGHGVGLSQHGANILAKCSFSFTDILAYYYTGITLGFI